MKLTLSITETCSYTVEAEGATEAEAVKNAGRLFGENPLKYCDSVDERDAAIFAIGNSNDYRGETTDGQDVGTIFDEGMSETN